MPDRNLVPLTHHEVLALAEPFVRRGRQVDLAASARADRRIVFRERMQPGPGPDEPPIRETLELESFAGGSCRVTRALTRDGLRATLQAAGREPAGLLEAIESVPVRTQFRHGRGWALALSYDVERGGGRRLTRGVAVMAGMKLLLKVAAVRGVAADVSLTCVEGVIPVLPEDLLAVLGWDWAPLERGRDGWTARLRLRGTLLRRSARAEVELERAAIHIARTLSEAPAAFHQRLLRARWGVTLRRAIPLLTIFVLAGVVAMLARVVTEPEPATLMLLFHVPTALIALSFCLQEAARFEIPPRPRRCDAADWRGPIVHSANRP